MKTTSCPRWMRAGAFALALASSAFVIAQHSVAQDTGGDDLLNAIGQAFGEPAAGAAPATGAAPANNAAPAADAAQSLATPGDDDVAPSSSEAAPSIPAVVSQAEVASDAQFSAATGGDAPVENSGTRPRQLSVEPGVVPLYPEDTPAWIHAQPDYSTNRHVLPVASLPVADRSSVDNALDEQLLATMYAYVEEHIVGELGSGHALRDQITVDYIRRNLIDEPLGYVVELQTSTGPMYQKWVQLVVSPEQREQLQVWHEERIQRQRLGPVVAIVGALLAAVGGFHMLVRRPGKQDERWARNDRVELPVVSPVAAKPKKPCCKFGFLPIALLVATPIMIAVAVKRHRSEGREARIERTVELQLFAEDGMAPSPPDAPSRPTLPSKPAPGETAN